MQTLPNATLPEMTSALPVLASDSTVQLLFWRGEEEVISGSVALATASENVSNFTYLSPTKVQVYPGEITDMLSLIHI